MRCDQHMGLSADAIIFLQENEVPEETCEFCLRPYPRKLEKISYYVGMFEDHFPLHRHQLVDGRFADEYVQSSAWSSGPCFFLGLKIIDSKLLQVDLTFEWGQSIIDAA